MSCFNELYEVSLKEYFVKDGSNLAAAVGMAIAEGTDIVIGGEVVCAQAARYKCPSIFLESGEEIYSILIKVNFIPVIANIAPVQIGLAVERVIISFSERGRVEEMEEEIRREQYHRGNTTQYTFENIGGKVRNSAILWSWR